ENSPGTDLTDPFSYGPLLSELEHETSWVASPLLAPSAETELASTPGGAPAFELQRVSNPA
ncbi:unnamed protein product, partial [Heterosigma akashiwo]